MLRRSAEISWVNLLFLEMKTGHWRLSDLPRVRWLEHERARLLDIKISQL